MILRRLTRREQNTFVICLLFLFGYISYQGALKPLGNRLAVLDKKIEAEQKKFDKDLRILRKANLLQDQYNEYAKRFKQDKSNEQMMSGILSEIERVAEGLKDLRISDLKPKIVQNQDIYNEFSVSLTIESNFVTIMEFLHILQIQPHFFRVDEVRFDNTSYRESKTIKTQLILSKVTLPAPSAQ